MKLRNILIIIILTWSILTIPSTYYLKPGPTQNTAPQLENGVRIAFFSDIHIQNEKEQVQTDIGSPSSEISKNGKIALNSVKPDYIFSTGDLTTHAETNEWIGYKKWENDLKAPVFDVLGNHDRDHQPDIGTYGTGYYTKVGRVSGTKILKTGNNIFILISEEHNPEYDNNDLGPTIPEKRFEFAEKYLKKYSDTNNIFIISHVPLSGTTAFSKAWYYGNNKNWIHITNKYLDLLDEYEVVAHISGHIHSDYRWIDSPHDQDGTIGVENISKFISGNKINKANRLYPPYRLPDTYFLNMPALDFAHGWLARFYFVAYPNGNPSTKTDTPDKGSPFTKIEEFGPPITDMLHSPKTSYILGRSAIYFTNFKENSENLSVITRWASGNSDVENYQIKLRHPIDLGDKKMHFIASDLSLRRKENLIITRDNWFKIKSNSTGIGFFSKKYRYNKTVTGLHIENQNLDDYSAKWMGSKNRGNNWENKWHTNPREMGEVNAVKIKIQFQASNLSNAFIKDIDIKTENNQTTF